MTHNFVGIVLKKRNWRENDLEIIFFSPFYGKMRLIATGARKFQSKLSGHLEPFNEVKIMLAEGKVTDKIGQAVCQKSFLNQKKIIDWEAGWAAQTSADFLDKILPEKQAEPRIYQLFKNYLLLLARTEAKKISPLFNWQLIILSGFSPILDHCANCGGEVEKQGIKFSVSKGGLLCQKCSLPSLKIDLKKIKILKHLVTNSGLKKAWIKLTEKEALDLGNLFYQFYSYHILK